MNKILANVVFNNPFPVLADDGSSALQRVTSLALTTLGAISIIVIIYAGIRLSASRGNPEAIGKLRSTLIYAAIGLFVALSATGIIEFVLSRV